MQIGIRLHDTVNVPITERVPIVKEQGFSCVHLALSKVITENSVDNSALTPGYAMYLKRLFNKSDIDIAVLGCYLNLANPNTESLKKITDKYLANIRFAAHLGCGVVGTETGAPNEGYETVPECYTEEALQTFITNLKPVVKYAECMGVLVAIEPVVRHIVNTPARARRVLDEINSPNLRIILDPVNLLDITNYKQQDEVIAEAIRLLGEDIAILHIKDYAVEDGALKECAAGFGQMNWKPVIEYVKKEKPYMQCTLENTVPDNAVAAREYIENLWKNS